MTTPVTTPPQPARQCDQQCGRPATVYAIDPAYGGWGGYYCDACVKALRFQIVDRHQVSA